MSIHLYFNLNNQFHGKKNTKTTNETMQRPTAHRDKQSLRLFKLVEFTLLFYYNYYE